MPGPALSETFTYNGTPEAKKGDKPNTLDREVVQSNRLYSGPANGTHAREPYRWNIPRNSGLGIGVGSNRTATAQPRLG